MCVLQPLAASGICFPCWEDFGSNYHQVGNKQILYALTGNSWLPYHDVSSLLTPASKNLLISLWNHNIILTCVYLCVKCFMQSPEKEKQTGETNIEFPPPHTNLTTGNIALVFRGNLKPVRTAILQFSTPLKAWWSVCFLCLRFFLFLLFFSTVILHIFSSLLPQFSNEKALAEIFTY